MANSFERYDKAVSPKLTKAGTLKLNVSVKKPYAMQTSGNSSPGSLDAQGTVTQKLLNIVYVDANNGNNNNLGDSKRAYLYACIIARKEQDPQTYESYRDSMRDFAMRKLREGRMN